MERKLLLNYISLRFGGSGLTELRGRFRPRKAFPGEGDRDSIVRFLSTNESGSSSSSLDFFLRKGHKYMINYDTSWDLIESDKGNLPDDEDACEGKYQEWMERDWVPWLREHLSFPSQLKRMEDEAMATL